MIDDRRTRLERADSSITVDQCDRTGVAERAGVSTNLI
jgi:hypothetical protein